MKKSEKLANLIGLPVEVVENNIDKGMWDILIELNKKGYYTIFSCEGHVNDKNEWEGYIVFLDTYNFVNYPPKFSKVNNHRKYYYWNGKGEESRQEYLDSVLKWARTLPTREKIKIVQYHLIARNKKQPNRDPKSIVYTNDYEEVKCIMNRADMDKYFDFELYEDIRYV